MINIKELAVGNWVKFPYGIDKIDELCMWANYAAPATNRPVHVLRLEPIEITPAILEKNGFVRRDDLVKRLGDSLPFICEVGDVESVIVEWRDSYDNGLRDENAEYLDEFWSLSVDGGIYTNFKKVDAKLYVHQLQNALTLCGINKEIKL